MLSATIDTGTLEATRKTAQALNAELREQYSLLQQAAGLDARVGRARSGGGLPAQPAYTWSSPGPTNLSSNLQKAEAQKNFRILFDGEIKRLGTKAESEGRIGSGRQIGRASMHAMQLLEGEVGIHQARGLLELGEMGLFGRRAVSFSERYLGALSEAAPAIMFAHLAIADIQESFNKANEHGERTRAFKRDLKKTFNKLQPSEVTRISEAIAYNVEKGAARGSFDYTIDREVSLREREMELISTALSQNPSELAAALNTQQLFRDHRLSLRVRPGGRQHMQGVVSEFVQWDNQSFERAVYMIKKQKEIEEKQHDVFIDDPELAARFHDELRMKAALERWHDKRARSWGTN